jgi:hypothetical protein
MRGTLHGALCVFVIISLSIMLRIRNISDKFVDKIKTRILYPNNFPEDRAVYEIMWKNLVQPDRPQMTT